MSRTIRNIPPRYGNVEWLGPIHQIRNMNFSGVRCDKGDRGDGVTRGWSDYTSVGSKRLGKRLARRAMRRASRRMEQQ